MLAILAALAMVGETPDERTSRASMAYLTCLVDNSVLLAKITNEAAPVVVEAAIGRCGMQRTAFEASIGAGIGATAVRQELMASIETSMRRKALVAVIEARAAKK